MLKGAIAGFGFISGKGHFPAYQQRDDVEIVAIADVYLAEMPVSRLGTVDDIASAVRFLSGPESSWITGEALAVDGGHHLRRGANYGLLFS